MEEKRRILNVENKPKKNPDIVAVRMSPERHKRLKIEAATRDITMQDLMEDLLDKYFDKE